MALVLGHSYGAEGWALLAISVGVGIFTNTVVKGNPLTLFAIDVGFTWSTCAYHQHFDDWPSALRQGPSASSMVMICL